MEAYSVKVKICGLSRPADIDYVNEAGPDYCGFVINVPKSIRNTMPDQVRALRERLSPDIVPVGVFRNEPVETVAGLLLEGTIGVAQLHGNEDEAYIQELRSRGNFTIIKAFRAPVCGTAASKSTSSLQKSANGDTHYYREMEDAVSLWADAVNASSADLVLLDHGGGGTGETFEWTLTERIRRPYFLAGGLGPDNIAEALNRLHPWGVDMSSSVETDGRKDREKILAAVTKARRCCANGSR